VVGGCNLGGKNVHDERKGSQTVRNDNKYSLCGIEWQRRRVAVFLQESYGCNLGGKMLNREEGEPKSKNRY
jgi:hypothetical protein